MKNNVTNQCYHFNMLWIDHQIYPTSLHVILTASNGITALPAFLLNFFIVYTIFKTPALKEVPSMIVIGNIAMSDLAVGLIGQPLYIICQTLQYVGQADHHLCYVSIIFYIFCSLFSGVSLVNLTISSIDRYLALRLHLRYSSIVTSRKLLSLCAFSWIAVLAFSLSWLFINYEFYSYVGIVSMLVCLLANLYCYGVIFKTIRKHKNEIQAQIVVESEEERNVNAEKISNYKKMTKSVITAMFIYGIFFCCYLPQLVIALVVQVSGDNLSTLLALHVSSTLIFINSCINPFVFLCRVEDLRNAFLRRIPKFVSFRTSTA